MTLAVRVMGRAIDSCTHAPAVKYNVRVSLYPNKKFPREVTEEDAKAFIDEHAIEEQDDGSWLLYRKGKQRGKARDVIPLTRRLGPEHLVKVVVKPLPGGKRQRTTIAIVTKIGYLFI